MATSSNSATPSPTSRSSTRTTLSTSSTVTTSPSRTSTNANTSSSAIESSSTRAASTSTGSAAPSLATVANNNSGSGALNMASVVAIAVVISLVGAGLLILVVLLLRRRRKRNREVRGNNTNVVYRDPSKTRNRPPPAVARPYNQPRDLQSWINARREGGHEFEGGGSSTLASPTGSELAESNWPKIRSSPSPGGVARVTSKPLPPSPRIRATYSDNNSARSSVGVPVRGWREVVNRAEAIPIPNGRPLHAWAGSNSDQEQGYTRDSSPYHVRKSNELFRAAPAHSTALVESSPTPSSMCVHDISANSHEETKVGNIPSNLPLVHFPQDHEGHISARASMHSGNTHQMQLGPIHGIQRIRTSSLPMAHLRKARSVETMGSSPRKPVHRPSRKEVPKYVLDEFGEPIAAPISIAHSGPPPPSHSMSPNRPTLHSKSRSISMAPSIPAQ